MIQRHNKRNLLQLSPSEYRRVIEIQWELSILKRQLAALVGNGQTALAEPGTDFPSDSTGDQPAPA